MHAPKHKRTELVMAVIGWHGGTVHQLCAELGLTVHNFLYDEVDDAVIEQKQLDGSFSQGWFTARTCSAAWVCAKLVPATQGNLAFWLGAADGKFFLDNNI